MSIETLSLMAMMIEMVVVVAVIMLLVISGLQFDQSDSIVNFD